jgi:hypothetical protein
MELEDIERKKEDEQVNKKKEENEKEEVISKRSAKTILTKGRRNQRMKNMETRSEKVVKF